MAVDSHTAVVLAADTVVDSTARWDIDLDWLVALMHYLQARLARMVNDLDHMVVA